MRQVKFLFVAAMALSVPWTVVADNATAQRNPLIVGGQPVNNISDTPWQAALVYNDSRNQFCGGTLVDEKWVLTAAHCVDNWMIRQNPSRLEVVVGTLEYATGGEQIGVSKIYVNPKWNSSGYDFDAALLELETAATAGKALEMVEPGADAPAVDLKVRVSGWGATSEGGSGAEKLLYAEVPVVDTAVCNKPESYDGEVTAAMFCAGQREGGLDSCQGDSGGPVDTIVNENDRLVGIVSWGYGCARELKYGVYTRVSAISEWATETIEGDAQQK